MPRNLMRNGEMYLYGYVGGSFFDEGFTAGDVLDALSEHGPADLTVHINSGGGYVYDGIAIYNALKSHQGQVTVHVDALAASAASVIAMAGDLIVMGEAALMMIHNASAVTIGDHSEHSKGSEFLKKIDRQAAGIYARRTGMAVEKVSEMMEAETWLSTEEAVEKGFADMEDGAVEDPTAFDYRIYQKPPERLAALAKENGWDIRAVKPAAPAAQHEKEVTAMAGDKTKTNGGATPNGQPQNPAPTPAPENTTANVDVNEIRSAGAREERDRIAAIQKAGSVAGVEQSVIDKAINDGTTADKARQQFIDLMADQQDNDEGRISNAVVTLDARDKFRTGAELAIMARAGLEGGERNEFTGLTLWDLARETLQMHNLPNRGKTRLQLVGDAFMAGVGSGGHSTSDFGNILANVASKAMLIGFEEAPETYPLITRTGTLTDFKPQKRVDLGLFDDLAEIPEGAEYTYGTFGDRAESIQLATYGKMFAITRQAVINDDLDAFSRIPRRMGRAAKRTIGNLVWAIFTGNPALSDNIALFHADHGNLASSGAAPSVATLDAAKTAMAIQTDPDGKAKTGLNIRPKYLVVPVALESKANVLKTSQHDPAKTQKVPNPHNGTFEVVSDARLDANSSVEWFMSADPNMHDTIEVAYLDGNQEPYMEQREGWTVDGAEMKIRIDAGVKPLDHRGLYKNPGQ